MKVHKTFEVDGESIKFTEEEFDKSCSIDRSIRVGRDQEVALRVELFLYLSLKRSLRSELYSCISKESTTRVRLCQ